MLNHKGTITLETNRLILRRAIREDAAPMFRNWASDPEVTKYLTWPTHTDPSVSAWIIDSWIEGYQKPDFYQWMIEPKALGEPIGSISVVRLQEDTAVLEIGYCIGNTWWHQGYTSEALGAVMDFLFRQVRAERVCARHDPRNPHSGAVMQKCGMVYMGTEVGADRNNQGICDAAHYAIDRAKYQK